MRDLMIEAIAIREQEAAISLPGAAQAPVEARPSAAPLKLSEQMSISSTSHPVVALEEADQVQAGATSSDADQIAIKRGALRASIERIVERMG
jgi:biopolymer transport protein ExbD